MKASANYSSRVNPATITLVFFAYFVIAVIALYFLNPAYSLLNSFAGNYDLGSYEFLIASTFFSLGFGALALVLGLYRGITRSARSWMGLILLGIWGVGMLLAGIFPANEGGSTVSHRTTALMAGIFPVEVQAAPETLFGFLHIFAILGSLIGLSLAAILLSRRFRGDENWKPLYSLSSILTGVMCMTSILFLPRMLFTGLLAPTSSDPLVFLMTGFVAGSIWLLLVTARLWFVFNRPVSK